MARRRTKAGGHNRLPFADVSEAEGLLLDLADFIYGHTALKPMSKTLFFLSRCLLVAESCKGPTGAKLVDAYRLACSSLDGCAPEDDFEFSEVVSQCEDHLGYVLGTLRRVRMITQQSDSLGLVFNTLLRGKFEGGEGLGTYLTPEEVVMPMVDMLLASADEAVVAEFSKSRPKLLYGDICGGTGRFVYAITRLLRESHECADSSLEQAARLFDQSSFAVDCGKLNFVFDGLSPRFRRVDDSLIDSDLSSRRGKFGLLATNPPFGTGKYRWNLWLKDAFSRDLLLALGLQGPDDAVDPSALFLFRNLDLLAPGGALAIVMPDGVVQSERFKAALGVYEGLQSSLQINALISLPVATFSLGGTVAKTSFLIVRKSRTKRGRGIYVASAKHVGFVKKGNRRVADPAGNDLVEIAADFTRKSPTLGTRVSNWRDFDRLAPSRLFAAQDPSPSKQERLCEFAEGVRRTAGRQGRQPNASCRSVEDGSLPLVAQSGTRITSKSLITDVAAYAGSADGFHVSVVDVDETGLIDIVSASRNQPATPGLTCKPGDVLVSCINPRIWRVAVVPEIAGAWSCSSEFLVLRPRPGVSPWSLAVALHHGSVLRTVQAMAGGTSSSRQRVPKDLLLDIQIPAPADPTAALERHAQARTRFYQMRLREARAYERLHDGIAEFDLG